MAEERHSYAAEAELITDPDLRAEREAQNGLKQFALVTRMIESSLDPERPFDSAPHIFRVCIVKD